MDAQLEESWHGWQLPVHPACTRCREAVGGDGGFLLCLQTAASTGEKWMGQEGSVASIGRLGELRASAEPLLGIHLEEAVDQIGCIWRETLWHVE